MARDRLNYAEQLSDIGAPVKGAAGDLYTQAGAQAGRAATIGAEATAGAIAFLGTQAIAAGKGMLESDEEKEIKDVLDKTEGIAPDPVQVEDREASIISSVATFMGSPPTAPEVSMMTSDAQRYVDAASQGLLTRDESIARIGAVVKKYSAMMPGWASDFRKVAANLTGINNIDVLQVHNALTQKGAKDRKAEQLAAANLRFQEDVSKATGTPIEQLTPAHYNLYRTSQQGKLAAGKMESDTKLKGMVQDEADKHYEQMLTIGTASGVSDLMLDMSKVWALNDNPAKFVESAQAGNELSAKLGMLHHKLAQNIRMLATPHPERPALSATAADRRLSQLDKEMKNYQDMVKTAEGRSMFLTIAKHAEKSTEMMLNNFQLANPHIAQLMKSGVFPPLFQAWMGLGGDKVAFARSFGKATAESMERMMNPASQRQHAAVYSGMVEGTGPSPRETARVDPALGAVQLQEGIATLTDPKHMQDTPESRQRYGNTFKSVTGDSLKYGLNRDVDKVYELTQRKTVQSYLATLTPQQKGEAITPMLVEIEKAAFNDASLIARELAAYNNPETNRGAQGGWRLSVIQNPITGQFEVKESRDGPNNIPQEVRRFGVRGGVSAPTGNVETRGMKQRIELAVSRLNKNIDSYHVGASVMSPEGGNSIVDMRNRVYQGIVNGKPVPLDAGFIKQLEGATAKPVDVPKNMIDALAAAESNGKANAVGDGGKAVGAWQMHPDAMVDSGFKPEDRSDPEKARAAATVYFGKKMQEFGGDVIKAIAAWNMGSAGFAKHMQAYGDMWMMELPEATKGLIKRFKQNLGSG